jgi:hypothetical protein
MLNACKIRKVREGSWISIHHRKYNTSISLKMFKVLKGVSSQVPVLSPEFPVPKILYTTLTHKSKVRNSSCSPQECEVGAKTIKQASSVTIFHVPEIRGILPGLMECRSTISVERVDACSFLREIHLENLMAWVFLSL